MTTWTVGQVADLLGITVRTLHHYDGIGLVRPSERSRTGYRLYTQEDLVRLQQVVVYRRLELPLDEIGQLLDGDDDPVDHLRRQRDAVRARLDELGELVAAIDAALEAAMSDRPATPEEMRDLFGDGFRDEWQEEAKQRWAGSDAYRQSAQRTKHYSKADWAAVKAEMEAVDAAFVEAKRAGHAPGSDVAMDAAEAHRRHIDERFYAVTHAFHRGLADMYLADPRFTRTYEDLEPGLAQHVHDAIHANADRHEA